MASAEESTFRDSLKKARETQAKKRGRESEIEEGVSKSRRLGEQHRERDRDRQGRRDGSGEEGERQLTVMRYHTTRAANVISAAASWKRQPSA